MTDSERDFFNDVKSAVSEYGCSFDKYHEDGNFCIDVTVNDMDEWADSENEIWNALSEVCEYWGAGIDSDMNEYYLCLGEDE